AEAREEGVKPLRRDLRGALLSPVVQEAGEENGPEPDARSVASARRGRREGREIGERRQIVDVEIDGLHGPRALLNRPSLAIRSSARGRAPRRRREARDA